MASFFSNTQKKGEQYELQEQLNNTDFKKKKIALMKVIGQMTVGKDVSSLFQSVIKCLELPDIEIKKLVYLYIINYSRIKPDDAIMVVNLFRRDIMEGTPLIKALAVRTMGCLRVPKINEYLIDVLKTALQDNDPYVKKTAVLCVSKVYEVSPNLAEDSGLIQILKEMLKTEGNPFVFCNLIITLYEITQIKSINLLEGKIVYPFLIIYYKNYYQYQMNAMVIVFIRMVLDNAIRFFNKLHSSQ